MATSTGPKISSRAMAMSLVDVGEQRGLEVEALVELRGDAAADHDPGAVGDGLLHHAVHPLELGPVHDGAGHVGGVLRVAVGDAADHGGGRLDALLVAGAGQEQAGAGGAALAAVGADAEQPPRSTAPPMSSTSSSTIWADLPPSSRKTRLMVAAPASMIRRPDRGGAGEAHHVDVGAGGEHLADRLVLAP